MRMLIGRSDELKTLRHRLDEAFGGRGSGTTVQGPVGSGVSTLLAAVQRSAAETGLDVLRGSGRRSESHIAMGLLRELAAGDHTGSLARALTAAGDHGAPDALHQWAAAAGRLAVIIDDAHLADELSLTAVSYLARRCTHVPVAVVIGSHEPVDLDAIELDALTISELVAVIVGSIDCSRGVATRVAELAEGSPLAALEVAHSLTHAQRAGNAPLPDFPQTHNRIRHVFDERLQQFDVTVRRALCVAAAEPSGEIRVIAAALAVLGGDISALEAAEEAGIVEISAGIIRFDHPLRRNVAYHQLAAPSRRAAHRALAAALDAPRDAERRAAHLAAGVIEPDETVAADLEVVARSAAKRGDHAEAARWWQRASELSPVGTDAARRAQNANEARRPRTDPVAGLTRAERRVAEVVGSGSTNKATAAELFVSVKTVDTHLQSIYRKLGIKSRAELAVLITRREQESGT